MNTEIEAKFLNVDHDFMREKLKLSGARLIHPMRLMTRVVIHTPEMSKRNAFVRVRDEGDRVTVTYKQFDSDTITGAKEHEIVVDDFEKAISIFESAGLKYDVYQETKRETWILDEVEVMLDVWPWLDSYVEIEGSSESKVMEVAEQLGFTWQDAIFGGVANAYLQQYPHIGPKGIDEINKKWTTIKFNTPPPELIDIIT